MNPDGIPDLRSDLSEVETLRQEARSVVPKTTHHSV